MVSEKGKLLEQAESEDVEEPDQAGNMGAGDIGDKLPLAADCADAE